MRRTLPSLALAALVGTPLALVAALPAGAAEQAVGSYAELVSALGAGDDAMLTADITGDELLVPAGASVTIDLAGFDLSATGSLAAYPGVGVPTTSTLTIDDSVGTGSLTAVGTQAAGIGSGGNTGGGAAGTIVIAGGTISASSNSGAGIGGAEASSGRGSLGSGGTVIITGGVVSATSVTGSAIGSGYDPTDPVTVSAGTLDIQGTPDAGSSTSGGGTPDSAAPTVTNSVTPAGALYSLTSLDANSGPFFELAFRSIVTFDSDGGSPAPADQEIDYAALATEPAAPSRGDDTFLGWYLDGSPYDFSAPVTGPLTLTATYEVAAVDDDDSDVGDEGDELAETGLSVTGGLLLAGALLAGGAIVIGTRRREGSRA